MLYTKFRGNRTTIAREEYFCRVLLTIYGRPSLICDKPHINIFYFLVPESLHTKFSSKQPSGFWEKPVLIFICK